MKTRIAKLLGFNKAPGTELHPLAITAFGLSFFMPIAGFIMGFIARTNIAYSNGKYSGDRLALWAILIAPVAQFSTIILAVAFALIVSALSL